MTELIISSNTLHHMAFMLNATIWLDMHMLSSVQQDVSVAIPVNWITPKTVRKNPFMLSTTHFHSVIITCMECSIKVTICALVGFCHLYSKFKEHTGTIWHNVWREIHIKNCTHLCFIHSVVNLSVHFYITQPEGQFYLDTLWHQALVASLGHMHRMTLECYHCMTWRMTCDMLHTVTMS